MKEFLILIDGNSLINRAFYALPPLSDKDGNPTQAVYGFCTMLIKAIADYAPTHVAVAFDLPAPTFRHKRYDAYKATRKGMPDELAVQLPILKRLLREMGVKIFEKEGYEADDILGTLCRLPAPSVIITGDRDAFQLIGKNTRVAFTKKGISYVELYDENKFIEEFCFAPAAIVDYKALCGDTSDNIPGVAGVGDKTASALVCKYGTLDVVYQNIDEIAGKLGEKLKEGRDSAYLSRELAKIDCNVPLDAHLSDCELRFPFNDGVREKFEKLNFRSLAARGELFGKEKRVVSAAEIRREIVIDLRILPDLAKGGFAFCVNKDAVLLAKEGVQYEIRLGTDLFGPSLGQIIGVLKPRFENENIFKAVLDAKQLKHTLREWGVGLNGFFDVKLAQYLLNVNVKFESLSEFCGEFGYKEEDAAHALWTVATEQKQKLKGTGLDDLYYKLELPLCDVLFDMENTGFKLDMAENERLGRVYAVEAEALTAEIFTLSGKNFNVNSPKQLLEVLFSDLQIPYPKKGKATSTAFEILDPLKEDYPIVAKILQYRKISKLISTYIEGYKRLADGEGVVRTEFKQALTVTGRLSSVEPNLQNIPAREEEGRKLRALFTAREGSVLISADYSQIELRLLAAFSGDSAMIQAFLNGEDIHKQTAAAVYGVPLDKVTKEMRQSAKAVNFGIVYGMSDFGLSQTLKISVAKAGGLIKRYFERFSGVKEYLDGCVEKAYRDGYVKTFLGRVRRIPELKSPNMNVRKFGERAAMNTPLQGSAADIIKAAMINVHKTLAGTTAKLILQVHDELIAEAEEKDADAVRELLVHEMENVVELGVPLRVEAGIGKRWIDCK
ncbi:MAG: DNA polymerase I [Firmicutes bacterium]|nr:DNA polymerase I [Bacillota bacterium]